MRSISNFLITVTDPTGKNLATAESASEHAWMKEVEHCIMSHGWSSSLFRRIVSSLVFEWTQKNVPHEREAGFQQAVLKIVTSEGGATAEYWFGPSTTCHIGPLAATERLELIRCLVGQVQSNRILEYRVFEHADLASDVTEIVVKDDAQAAEILLCDVVGVADISNAAKQVKHLIEKQQQQQQQKQQESQQTQTSSKEDFLKPVFDSSQLDKLSSEEWKLLDTLRDNLHQEYTERRRCARSRFAQSLLTLSTSTSASLDKVELRRRGDSELSVLGEIPNVGCAENELRGMRRVELLELVGGVRTRKITGFKLRSHLIPAVPDRGGRVNTHNFDQKVQYATHRADSDMRGKNLHERQQRQDAARNMHQDATRGVGLGSSTGMTGQQASQAAEQVRSRGGRWSGRGGGGGGGRGGNRY